MIVSVVTTFERPDALARSLPQIAALGWPVLVVDDHSGTAAAERNRVLCEEHGVFHLRMPANRGLAGALTIGVSYWLADPLVRWISAFQDDVDLAPTFRQEIEAVSPATTGGGLWPLVTGHDAPEHPGEPLWPSVGRIRKRSCRATHLHAHRDYWAGVLPIPSRKLGAPCREPDRPRGTGSEVDHWIVATAPRSVVRRGGYVLCLPGLVRSFYWRKADSCWDNESSGGEELPLGTVRPSALMAVPPPKLSGRAYVDFWRARMARGPAEAAHGGKDADAQAEVFWDALGPALASAPSPTTVVEVGSGYGRMLQRVRSLWPHAAVHGIDLSPEAIAGSWRDVRTSLEVALTVPEGVRADVLYTCTCLQHVTDTAILARLAASIEACLRPGGRLVLLENIARPPAPHVRSMGADDYRSLFSRIRWDPQMRRVEWCGELHEVIGGWRNQ